METLHAYTSYSAVIIEIIGVITIMIATFLGLYRYFYRTRKGRENAYHLLRVELGKGILLGLEILVAGDIISTVVTDATMDRVLALGVIVLIRTFLSWSIELEIEGHFPWQRESKKTS